MSVISGWFLRAVRTLRRTPASVCVVDRLLKRRDCETSFFRISRRSSGKNFVRGVDSCCSLKERGVRSELSFWLPFLFKECLFLILRPDGEQERRSLPPDSTISGVESFVL